MVCVTRMDLMMSHTLIPSLLPGVPHTAEAGCPGGDSVRAEAGGKEEVRAFRKAVAGVGHNLPGDDNHGIMIHIIGFL